MVDQAVWTALISAGSAITGGVLTAWGTFKIEDKKQATLRQQATEQAKTEKEARLLEVRVEHLRWLRNRRQTIYLEFAQALEVARRAIGDSYVFAHAAAAASPSVKVEMSTTLGSALSNLSAVLAAVRIEGPAEVDKAATAVRAQVAAATALLSSCVQQGVLTDDDKEKYRQVLEKIGEKSGWFVTETQKVLSALEDLDGYP
ncbi:hypothetical protein GCM10009759_04280 [Kitasatospora saccharophila]|uniref:Uncharacterized protein n=1 Tax=Kitasatospora saccharophila TaxID=407973 RepID=A0ABP5HST4_9ACTN